MNKIVIASSIVINATSIYHCALFVCGVGGVKQGVKQSSFSWVCLCVSRHCRFLSRSASLAVLGTISS